MSVRTDKEADGEPPPLLYRWLRRGRTADTVLPVHNKAEPIAWVNPKWPNYVYKPIRIDKVGKI